MSQVDLDVLRLAERLATQVDMPPPRSVTQMSGGKNNRVWQIDNTAILKGYVYGPGIQHVCLYPGAAEALRGFVAAGHTLFLISHKTRTPFAGPAYALHEWAWKFLAQQRLIDASDAPFDSADVAFELTREQKLARIAVRRAR